MKSFSGCFVALSLVACGTRAGAGSSDSASTGDSPSAPSVASDVPARLEPASLTMGALTINGQRFEDVTCRGNMSLFGGSPLESVAGARAALEGCVPAGSRPRVHFAFANDVVQDVRVADAPSPRAAHCLASALRVLRIHGEGACVSTLLLGATAPVAP